MTLGYRVWGVQIHHSFLQIPATNKQQRYTNTQTVHSNRFIYSKLYTQKIDISMLFLSALKILFKFNLENVQNIYSPYLFLIKWVHVFNLNEVWNIEIMKNMMDCLQTNSWSPRPSTGRINPIEFINKLI